ncbi:TetR/AcrR family transcriptional regulator [Hirschia litorea]|uniref:TetR/AcrR family transcriptional regulator n=1 Tax=Hirschia litorea TaxID=1199156 RepID=A0ABW2IP30_9PROT
MNTGKITKLDGRRIKSREKLKKSLAVLLERKSLEKITIEELAREADVTRPTFYSNYKDVQAIVIEYVHELMKKMVAEFQRIDVDQSMTSMERIEASLVYYMEMLQNNNCILLSAASGRAGDEALELMRSYSMRILLVRADRVPTSGMTPLDLQISMFFYSGAINTALEAHASGKIEATREQLAKSIATLIHQGLGQELGNPVDPPMPILANDQSLASNEVF